MRVLVTGANGFVSAAAVRRLQQGGAEVLSAVRACDGARQLRCTIDGGTCWQAALAGVDVVFHAAAQVHMRQDRDR